MTATNRRNAPTSGQLGPKLRVWGATPTSRFSQKIASVMTLALLAVLWIGLNFEWCGGLPKQDIIELVYCLNYNIK